MGKGATSHSFFFLFSPPASVSTDRVTTQLHSAQNQRRNGEMIILTTKEMLAYCQTITPYERLKLNSLHDMSQSLREDGNNMIK